jgi:transcriptional regulator with XRE-family HTH domain
MIVGSESNFIKALGQRIAFHREKKGFSLIDFSANARIKVEDIVAYENGRRSIQIEDLLKIAKALDIDVSQLVDGIVI